MIFKRSTLLGSFCIAFSSFALAGPLQHAEIHKVINDVRIVDPDHGVSHSAALRDLIQGNLAVQTGMQSRAELLFQDQTLTRLGADSLFSFTPNTRDMTLDRGTMLLQVPKGLGGARIRTAAVTAAITGTTILLENKPGSHVKVLVLEGTLRLSFNGNRGHAVVLTPGRMIILHAGDKKLPKPVDVDLAKVVQTSTLVNPLKFKGNSRTQVKPLPSLGLIQHQISIQEGLKHSGRLTETDLLINANGHDVVAAASEQPMVAFAGGATSLASVLSVLDARERANGPVVNRPSSGSAIVAANGSVSTANTNPASTSKSTSNSTSGGGGQTGSGSSDTGSSTGNGNNSGNGNDSNNGDGSSNGKGHGNGDGKTKTKNKGKGKGD